jgi:hypothetical protein
MMPLMPWVSRSGHLLVARGVRLHARLASSNIRLSLMDAAQTDITVGARRSGGYRFAVLRAHDIWKTRQQYCDDNHAPMFHAASIRQCALICKPRRNKRSPGYASILMERNFDKSLAVSTIKSMRC